MNNTAKKVYGFFSFVPIVAWTIWCVYILIVTRDLIFTQTYQDHEKVVTALADHFNGVLSIWIIATALTFIMLIVNVVHLARIRNMHGGNKAAWMVFMVALGPLSFPVFWYVQIRNEAKDMPYYPNIA